jgi:5-methylcytosine-specific restriction endonuclease McrA
MNRPCAKAGCNAIVRYPLRYCTDHAHLANQHRSAYDTTSRRITQHLADSADFRNSHKWRQVRKVKLSLNPLCEDPYREHERRQLTATATQVHHIVGLKQCANDERAYSLDNLMSVCTRCHARLERDVIKKGFD